VRHYYHEVSYYQSGVRGVDLYPAYENHGAPNDGVVGWVQVTWNDTIYGALKCSTHGKLRALPSFMKEYFWYEKMLCRELSFPFSSEFPL